MVWSIQKFLAFNLEEKATYFLYYMSYKCNCFKLHRVFYVLVIVMLCAAGNVYYNPFCIILMSFFSEWPTVSYKGSKCNIAKFFHNTNPIISVNTKYVVSWLLSTNVPTKFKPTHSPISGYRETGISVLQRIVLLVWNT